MNALESIYFAALEKPAAERPAFLDAACGTDADLRARVERLLAAQPKVGGFLDAPAATGDIPADPPAATFGDSAGTADFPGRDDHVGAVLGGKYKLVEAIGEGGMGSVFMAQQTEPVRRAVAVKVIKAGMDSKAVLARFEAERQALAMMDHPNIARVLDAGTTEGGRPYFVMELVKGLPITKFCDERKLTPRQRLELFVPICQAIQHAHQKGVIHRDIKPSNVLVALYDDKPVPKVIDFGIAKAAGSTLTDKTLMTGFGAVVGTPEYMSPEQASLNNLDIDTRSDVYSLGVLLYELLTGTTPVDRKSLGKAALLEVLRVVREVEAPKPSAKLSTIDTLTSVATNRGTDPARLSKLMKGELDWVVLKALEKDRTRRYETANGLAADVQRYLAGEAIQAVPPTLGYRLRKAYRRNRAAVLVACGFAALLVAATAVSVAFGLAAQRAEGAADARRQDAEDSEAKARQSEGRAVEAGGRLRDARDELWSSLYTARCNLVQTAWDGNNITRVRELLGEQVPRNGERDLRGFEWHYFDRRAHAELRTVSVDAFFSTLSADGRRLVGGGPPGQGGAVVWDAETGRRLATLEAKTADEKKGESYSNGHHFTADGGTVYEWVNAVLDPRVGNERVGYLWDSATGKRRLRLDGFGPDAGDFALSPDGRQLLWTINPKGGKPALHVRNLAGEPDPYTLQQTIHPPNGIGIMPGWLNPHRMRSPVWSANGSKVAVTFELADGCSQVWVFPVRKNKGLNLSQQFPSTCRCLQLSADGRRMVVSHQQPDSQFRVDCGGAGTGWLSFRSTGRPARLSPDDRLLASLSGEVVEVRDARTGRLLQTLRGHTTFPYSLAFSPDGARLTACDLLGTARAWDVTRPDFPDGPSLDTAVDNAGFAAFGVSRDGERLLTVKQQLDAWPTTTDTVTVWDRAGARLATLKATLEHEAHTGLLESGGLDRSGRRAAYAHSKTVVAGAETRDKGQVTVWDVGTGRPLFSRTEWGRFGGCGLSPDGTRVAAVFAPPAPPEPRAAGGTPARMDLIVWEVDSGREVGRFPAGEAGEACESALAFSPDGTRLVLYRAGLWKNSDLLASWDLPSGQQLWARTGPPSGQFTGSSPLTWAPDGRRFAHTRGGPKHMLGRKLIDVVDADTGRVLSTFHGHPGSVSRAEFSPDGRLVASGDLFATADARLRVWDAASGRPRVDLPWPGMRSLTPLGFSPDGHRLTGLAVGETARVVEWDATPRPAEGPLTVGQAPVPGRGDPGRTSPGAGAAGRAGRGREVRVTKEEAKAFADQSVAALADVVKAGWALPSELRELDFDAVRGRDDFRKLVAEVEAKAEKAPETAPPVAASG